jgi:hypothetical protein
MYMKHAELHSVKVLLLAMKHNTWNSVHSTHLTSRVNDTNASAAVTVNQQ